MRVWADTSLKRQTYQAYQDGAAWWPVIRLIRQEICKRIRRNPHGHWLARVIRLIRADKPIPTFKPPKRHLLLLKPSQSDCSGSAGCGLQVRSNQRRRDITRTTSIAIPVLQRAVASDTTGVALWGWRCGSHTPGQPNNNPRSNQFITKSTRYEAEDKMRSLRPYCWRTM